MKLKEKLALEAMVKIVNEPYMTHPSVNGYFGQLFLAGFKKAREMAANCAFIYEPDDTDGHLTKIIRQLGEEEV